MAGAVLVEGTGRTDAVGVAWAMLALGCEAAFTLCAVPVLRRHSPWGVSVHAIWLAAVMLAALGTMCEGPSAIGELTGLQWAAVGYLALLVTAVAFVLWYSTVRAAGSGRAGLLTGIAPLAAAAVGAVTGRGTPGPSVWLGIAVLIVGLIGGLRPRDVPAEGVTDPGRSVTTAPRPHRLAADGQLPYVGDDFTVLSAGADGLKRTTNDKLTPCAAAGRRSRRPAAQGAEVDGPVGLSVDLYAHAVDLRGDVTQLLDEAGVDGGLAQHPVGAVLMVHCCNTLPVG
ncbi:EamA family transporter [Streptomyces lasalocidi]